MSFFDPLSSSDDVGVKPFIKWLVFIVVVSLGINFLVNKREVSGISRSGDTKRYLTSRVDSLERQLIDYEITLKRSLLNKQQLALVQKRAASVNVKKAELSLSRKEIRKLRHSILKQSLENKNLLDRYRLYIREKEIGAIYRKLITHSGQQYYEAKVVSISNHGLVLDYKNEKVRIGLEEMPSDWLEKMMFKKSFKQ